MKKNIAGLILLISVINMSLASQAQKLQQENGDTDGKTGCSAPNIDLIGGLIARAQELTVDYYKRNPNGRLDYRPEPALHRPILKDLEKSSSSSNSSTSSDTSTKNPLTQPNDQLNANTIARVQQIRAMQSTLRSKQKSYSTDDFVSQGIQTIKKEHPELSDIEAYQVMLTKEKK